MKTRLISYSLGAAIIAIGAVQALSPSPSPAGNSVPVTVDNFIRAETDRTFAGQRETGALRQVRAPPRTSRDRRSTRPAQNRDTLYSVGVFDLDAGPVTITLPDSGKRFMTMIVIDEDHYVYTVVYGKGSYTFSKEQVGTRYALAAIRTLVDPNDPKDIEQVARAAGCRQGRAARRSGEIRSADWDQASRKKIGDALTVLGATLVDWRGAAGRKDEVDPVRHLIVTATGWGLNPDKDAIYLNVTPSKNDGKTDLQAQREGCAGRWLLVDHSLQRRRIFREERPGRVFV